MSIPVKSVVPNETHHLMLRLGELWLKGNNQKHFIRLLRHQLLERLQRAVGKISLMTGRGRVYIRIEDATRVAAAAQICADTPGITSVSPILEIEADIDLILTKGLELAKECWSGRNIRFAVKAKRTDKRFEISSTELNRRLGHHIHGTLGLEVDLSNPTGVLGLEVNTQKARLWAQVLEGVGGLPVGSAGQVLLLLSGGIDSPVAGFLSQKRGCYLEALYFHSPPFISEGSKDKVVSLAKKLASRQGGMRLHIVKFTDVQKAIKQRCDPRFTVLLYRSLMYRIADRIVTETQSKALCTGENLAQVASQTLENLTVVDRLTQHLTLRPLLTYDKEQIVEIARKIDTFDLSTLPFEDCCTLFVPKHPITKARPIDVQKQEVHLDVELLVSEAVTHREVIDIGG